MKVFNTIELQYRVEDSADMLALMIVIIRDH